MALYYFYLFYPELGGLLPAADIGASVIHFLGGRKPWLHTPESIRESLQEQQRQNGGPNEAMTKEAQQWTIAMDYWYQLVDRMNADKTASSSSLSHRPFALQSFRGKYIQAASASHRGRIVAPLNYVEYSNPTGSYTCAPGANFTITFTVTNVGSSSAVSAILLLSGTGLTFSPSNEAVFSNNYAATHHPTSASIQIKVSSPGTYICQCCCTATTWEEWNKCKTFLI